MMKLGDVAREYKEKHTGPKEGVPVVGLEHLTPDDLSLSSWSDNQNNTFTKAFKTGHILFGRRRAYQRKAAIAPFDGICSGDITVIEAIPNKINPDLLPFLIHNHHFFDYAVGMSAGSMSPRVKWEYLKEYRFRLEPVESQCQAAQILKTANELKLSYLRLLSATDEIVKSRFVEMFGDPVQNTKGLEVKELATLGTLERGRSRHRPRNAPELLGGPYPLIQTGDVAGAGLYLTEFSSTYSEIGLQQSRMWEAGTLCITIAANIAQTTILKFDSCFPDSVVGFIPGLEVTAEYMYYWFTFFQQLLEKQAPQVAQKNINLEILSKLRVIVPNVSQVQQFTDFAKQTDKSKFAIQQSIIELETLKKALMQKYFGAQ